jgi:hypothetical protein
MMQITTLLYSSKLSTFLRSDKHKAFIAVASHWGIPDVIGIFAVALVLASRYGVERLHGTSIRFLRLPTWLAFPHLHANSYAIDSAWYLPWTDVAENVFGGLEVARGGKVYDAVMIIHAPGVLQYLAMFLRLLGFQNAAGSPSTELAAMLTGTFATLIFQVACTWFALRLLSVPRFWCAIIAVVVCGYTAFFFNFGSPMSETLIPYILIFVPLLTFRMLFLMERRDRVASAVILVGPITLACLSLGLTAGPANAWIALVCLAVLVREFALEPKQTVATIVRDRRCWASYFVVLLVMIVHAETVELHNAYFWMIDINRNYRIEPWNNISSSFFDQLLHFGGVSNPIGSRYPELIVLLVSFSIAMQQSGEQNRRGIWVRLGWFAIVLMIAAIATQWRFYSGYKAVTMLGISLGVFLLLLSKVLPPVPRWGRHFFAVLLIMACMQVMFLRAIVSYDTKGVWRNPAFDLANVCRYGQSENCRCLQVTVWGPQFYLENDVIPCRERYHSMNPFIGSIPAMRATFFNDTRRNDTAFVLYSDSLMLENGIPPEAIAYWRDHGKCTPLNNLSICVSGTNSP